MSPRGLTTPPLEGSISSHSSNGSPSSSSSPRRQHFATLSAAGTTESNEGDSYFTSDSYDSASESTDRRVAFGRRFGGEEDENCFGSVSRAGSPVPPEAWEGYRPELLSYRASRNTSRNPSRQQSGQNSPILEKEAASDCK